MAKANSPTRIPENAGSGAKKSGPGRRRIWLRRLMALLGGCLLALIAVEVVLTVAGLPQFPRPVQKSPQFDMPAGASDAETPLYRNTFDGRIRFVYHDNPRGYFGENNEVVHRTNSQGFRGPEFPTKPKSATRIVFLGDSFTFGEGVKLADTFAAQTCQQIQAAKPNQGSVQAFNLGVSGYNTEQSLQLFLSVGLKLKPQVVVLGFVLNDPEPPLFFKRRFGNRITRRVRRLEGWFSEPMPPPHVRFRISKLIWNFAAQRARTARTLAHYRRLFEDDYPGWPRCQRALKQFHQQCRHRNILFRVVVFPVLYQLEDYPFDKIHERVAKVIPDNVRIDLLPVLRGRQAAELWVHPTDQHPNEIVHRLAGQEIAASLLPDLVKRATSGHR